MDDETLGGMGGFVTLIRNEIGFIVTVKLERVASLFSYKVLWENESKEVLECTEYDGKYYYFGYH